MASAAGQLERAHPLARHIEDFLADLANANASAQTIRAYRGISPSSPPTTTSRAAS